MHVALERVFLALDRVDKRPVLDQRERAVVARLDAQDPHRSASDVVRCRPSTMTLCTPPKLRISSRG